MVALSANVNSRPGLAGSLSTPAAGGGGFGGGFVGGDAGVRLYSLGQAVGNTQDLYNSANADAEKARKIIADVKASKGDKDAAQKTVDRATALGKEAEKAQAQAGAQINNPAFVRGFGSNGGEEFLSFLNISEMLVVKAGKEWADWDGKMQDSLPKAQDGDGSWSGHHCITGKTFCTSAALLVLLADRTQFPDDVIKAARDGAKKADEKK